MYFTQEDYKKIENWLHRNSVKDTEFQEALPFTGKEIVTVVQDGHNRKVNIQEFINQLYKHGVEGFLNVTNTYRANNITLKEAIGLIPAKARKEGQVITFLNTDGNWEIYQFIGKLNQWNNPTLWNNPFDWEKLVVDSILPDEEDLTKSAPDAKGNAYLSLKNRKYEPDKYSGLGRKILRRRVVEIEDPIYGIQEKNLLLQADFAEDNTVYVVRYDFTLNGQDITLPDNSYIEYEGGSISDGNIIDRAGGLNRVVLKKNITNDKNILTQEMISKSNTIYECKYDFDLNGQDITLPDNSYIEYNGGSISNGNIIDIAKGLNRVILRKNIKEGKNILTQDMINKENTIYVIKYDFTLNEDITIPANCVLEFDGGSLKGNTIIGNHTKIIAGDYQIFKKGLYRYRGYAPVGTTADFAVVSSVIGDNINIKGTWDNDFVSSAWIGLDTISEQEDSAPLIMDYINLHKSGIKIDLPKRTYGIYGQIAVKGRIFDGNNSIFNFCHLSDMYDASIPIPEGTVALNPTYFPYGLPLTYQNIYVSGVGGELRNFTIDQSNITISDINLNEHWGIYGLCGKRGAAKNIIRNVIIQNAYECCFIGIQGETEFIDCVFNGSGEHEVYGRPDGGNVTFKNCYFTNWENIQDIATARGVAFAIKCVPQPSRVENSVISLIDCVFEKGNSYSSASLEIDGDEIRLLRCKTDVELSHLGIEETKEIHIYIEDCDGIFAAYNKVGGLKHVINSRGSSQVLNDAYEIEGCTLYDSYISNVDKRVKAHSSIADKVKYFSIRNTTLIKRQDIDTKIVINGAYYISCYNFNIITADGISKGPKMGIFTNSENTEIVGITPYVKIESSNFYLGKRYDGFIEADRFNIYLTDCIFEGEKYFESGYLSRLYIISSCNSLTLNRTYAIPSSKDNTTILGLYTPTITPTYMHSTPTNGNPASNIGLQDFDYVNKKPIWWTGSKWVDATGADV